jgi:predicted acyltransferase
MSQLASNASAAAASQRLVSLDQFRGYTVAGMMLVNFIGAYAACPRILRHTHDYVSYADTIMPQFLFAVGFAFRLTFGRRVASEGLGAAYRRVVRRLLGLVLVSLVVYTVGRRAETWQALTELGVWGAIADPLKRSWFQTLMHIAVTGLWLTPVIRASAPVRILWMLGSAAAHVALSYAFNFNWVNGVPRGPNGIDGGPLGFLTWTIPAGVGTLACDAIVSARSRWKVTGIFGWAVLLMGLGYVISCGTRFYDVPPAMIESLKGKKLAEDPVWPSRERINAKLSRSSLAELLAEPPLVPPPGADQRKWNYWMMSQRAGTLSYVTFSAGFSLAVYLLFHVLCDWCGLQLPLFRTFGTNALAAYVLHDMVASAVEPFVPKDAPGWYVVAGLLVFFWITWLFVRTLEKQGFYLRV